MASALGSEPELVAAAPELGEPRGVAGVTRRKGQRIDARPPGRVRPLISGAVPGSEERGRRHEADAAGARVRISGHARLGKVGACARTWQARRLHVFERGDETASTVV